MYAYVTLWQLDMKKIYGMKRGFITLDSYPETHETRGRDWLAGIVMIAIAAMTAGAMLGIDITSPATAPSTPPSSPVQLKP